MVKLNVRQIAILALLGLFGLLAITPVLIFEKNSQVGIADVAYQALKIYSRSQLGDRSADAAAIEVYPTLKRHVENGKEYYTRLGVDNACWELDLNTSSEPYKTDKSRCEER